MRLPAAGGARMMPWSDLLYVNLGWGRDRVRTIGALSEAMGAPRRAIEKAVEELRLAGAPVCSCAQGIYLSTDADELLAQVEALRRRAIHQLVGARSLRRTARLYQKQQQLAMFG